MSAWEKESYLQEVCAHIRWKRAHEAVRRELGDHIDDQRQAFVEAGLPEEEAVRRAVEEMGDPAEAGARLNRHYRPYMDKKVWMLLIAMAAAGILVHFIAADVILDADHVHGWSYTRPERWIKQLLLGAVGAFAAYRLRFECIAHFSFLSYGGLLAYLYLHMPAADMRNGRFYFMHFAVFPLALLFANCVYNMRGSRWKGIMLAAILAAGGAYAMLLVPSVESFFLLGAVVLTSLLWALHHNWFGLAGLKRKGGALALAAIALAGVWQVGWRQNPQLSVCYGQEECDYYSEQVQNVVSSARWVGPQVVTELLYERDGKLEEDVLLDYVGANVVARLLEKTGWVPLLSFLLLYAGLLAACVRRCIRQPSKMGQLLSLAVVTIFAYEAAAAFAGNLFPIIGNRLGTLYLPFVSTRLDYVALHFTLCGFLLGIFRNGSVVRDGSVLWRLYSRRGETV